MVMIITQAAMGGEFNYEECHCTFATSWPGARTQRENTEVDKMDDKASEIDEANQMDNDEAVQRQAEGTRGIKESCSTDKDCKYGLECRKGKGKNSKWCKSGM